MLSLYGRRKKTADYVNRVIPVSPDHPLSPHRKLDVVAWAWRAGPSDRWSCVGACVSPPVRVDVDPAWGATGALALSPPPLVGMAAACGARCGAT